MNQYVTGTVIKDLREKNHMTQAELAEKLGEKYRLASPEEESQGIDGYVGITPYSVKPDTYKTMGRLSETIAVKMIYYTKTKTGLTIEVEE